MGGAEGFRPFPIWKMDMIKTGLKKLIPIIFILVGFGLLAYPWISEYLFENRTDSVINTYEVAANDTDNQEKQIMLEEAGRYNKQLSQAQVTLTDPFTEEESSDGEFDYDSVLALDDSGLMATIEIPKIAVNLPVYHGTSTEVLESGIGHLEGSSFPIGGESTHTVLSGHTGLNSAKLFTDLTELEKGDLFFLHVLGDTYTYQVSGIYIVLPEDTSKLMVQEGKDLVTLVTCTPYGVNSHRLLVTGTRMEYTEEIYEETVQKGSTGSESLWMQSYKRAIFIGLAMVFGFALILLIFHQIRRPYLECE